MIAISQDLSNMEKLKKMEAKERTRAITETIAINIRQIESISKRSSPTGMKGQYPTNLQEATK